MNQFSSIKTTAPEIVSYILNICKIPAVFDRCRQVLALDLAKEEYAV